MKINNKENQKKNTKSKILTGSIKCVSAKARMARTQHYAEVFNNTGMADDHITTSAVFRGPDYEA